MECVFTKKDPPCSWLAPPDVLTLIQDEIHVWCASLEMTPSQVKLLKQMLSTDELERAQRFHFQKDKDRFIVARGILRSILGRYLKMNPDKLKIYYGPYGKPALDEKTHGKSLRFNASYSHGLALFSFALDREIGVDLEYIRSDLSDGNIAAQFFSQREAVALNALPENVRQKAFFTLWTRKEAYLKAQGRGLSGDLKQLEVFPVLGCPSESPEINGSSQEDSPWLLMDLAVLPEYAAALAVEGHDLQFKFWQWEYA